MEVTIHKIWEWISVLTFLTTFCLAYDDSSIISNLFTKEDSCSPVESVDQGCAETTQISLRNLLTCAFLCKDDCPGIAWTNRTCYIYKSCPASVTCTSREFTFYRRKTPCQHNGVFDKNTDSCKCVDGWVGDRCERLPTHCKELTEHGYPKGFADSRWFYINISTYFEPISIRCVLYDTFEDWLIMANQGYLDNINSKNWTDYVNGYRDQGMNFWLGLEKIKALNEFGLSYLVLSTGFWDESGTRDTALRQYYKFQISNASSGYSFTFFESLPSYGYNGDCLSPLKGAKFSTWDNDNDEDDTRNCAEEAGVGWWFKDCNMVCNPLGRAYQYFPGPELKTHMKMDGVDLANTTAVKSVFVLMYFHRNDYSTW